MVVPLLMPRVAATILGIDGSAPGADYRYAAGQCAALMVGWTALLVWADRDPVARRGVLLLAVLPVVIGEAAAGGCAVTSGLVRPVYLAPTWTFQVVVSVLFLAACQRARTLARGGTTVGSEPMTR